MSGLAKISLIDKNDKSWIAFVTKVAILNAVPILSFYSLSVYSLRERFPFFFVLFIILNC